MLTHIVMWKYRGDASQDTRDEHLAGLRSLHSVVPGIESFSVGVDTLHSAKSYDTGLLAIFRDRAVLDAYTVHPDHVNVVEFGGSITGNFAELIAAAKANQLDFVIMTEHLQQDFDTAAMTLSGMHAGVLFMNGSEVATASGDRLLLIPGSANAAATGTQTTQE